MLSVVGLMAHRSAPDKVNDRRSLASDRLQPSLKPNNVSIVNKHVDITLIMYKYGPWNYVNVAFLFDCERLCRRTRCISDQMRKPPKPLRNCCNYHTCM